LPASDTKSPARFDRTLQLALFVTSGAWFFCSEALAGRAAQGFADRLGTVAVLPLLNALFLLFLLAVGFSLLQSISGRHSSLREVLGLPRRATAAREWGLGAALGWGLVVLAVLPMVLSGALYVQLWSQPRAFELLVLNLLTLGVAALAEEVAFRGYPYRRLIEAIGRVKATILLSLLFGLGHALNPYATWTSVLVTVLAGLLLSIGWLRTHGLWLPWGLHFAWNASMGVLFGLPISGAATFSSVVQTRTFGYLWLTGGDYGPEGAIFTIVALTAGIFLLVRLTRDYAWDYTFKPIVAGGYPTEIAPPAAHVAMEQQQSAPAVPGLVQILPVTPQSRSVDDDKP
jgi:membrane protease YdiL (CAAX protease family)